MLEAEAATGSSGKRSEAVGTECRHIQIGELARRSGCNVETVRYYERIGLLPTPARPAGGYTLYETADVRLLMFARRARELGFTLEEVGTLMALSTHNIRSACAEVRQLAADPSRRGSGQNRRSTNHRRCAGGCRTALRRGRAPRMPLDQNLIGGGVSPRLSSPPMPVD
jgi:MerR family transcriptional regulator, mercuric resistance operon regulatory protein